MHKQNGIMVSSVEYLVALLFMSRINENNAKWHFAKYNLYKTTLIVQEM